MDMFLESRFSSSYLVFALFFLLIVFIWPSSVSAASKLLPQRLWNSKMISIHQTLPLDYSRKIQVQGEGGSSQGNQDFKKFYIHLLYYADTYIYTNIHINIYINLHIQINTAPTSSLSVAFYTGWGLIIANDTQLCNSLSSIPRFFFLRSNFSCHLNSFPKWGHSDRPWSSIQLANTQWIQDA